MLGLPRGGLHYLLLGILSVWLMATAGCSSVDENRLPVQGKVLLGDQPLTTGTVILRPDSGKGNDSKHEPRGKIDREGKYLVFTALQAGAPPGWYKVGVIASEASDPKNPYAVPKSLIPLKYNDPGQSGLSLEVVKEAPPGAYDLKLQRDADGEPR